MRPGTYSGRRLLAYDDVCDVMGPLQVIFLMWLGGVWRREERHGRVRSGGIGYFGRRRARGGGGKRDRAEYSLDGWMDGCVGVNIYRIQHRNIACTWSTWMVLYSSTKQLSLWWNWLVLVTVIGPRSSFRLQKKLHNGHALCTFDFNIIPQSGKENKNEEKESLSASLNGSCKVKKM